MTTLVKQPVNLGCFAMTKTSKHNAHAVQPLITIHVQFTAHHTILCHEPRMPRRHLLPVTVDL